MLALIPLPAWGGAEGAAFIYVTNSAGDSIHVIDPATNKVVQEIKGIEAAHGIAASPDGARVYVSNEADSTLDVFDRSSGVLIKKVPLSNHPNNIAVTKSGDRILVAIARGSGAVDVVDATTLTRTKSILVKGRLHNIYVTPDGKYLIAGSIPGKLLTVIDLEREVPVWELPFDLGVRPMTIEAGSDGSTKRIFVQLSDTNGFAVVDFAARKEVARIKLPETAVEFETDAGRATSPSHGIGVAPDGRTLWVTSIPNNAVFVYALDTLKVIGEIALPDLRVPGHGPIASVPNWVTFTPDSKTIYISNAALRSVTAIDTQTKTIKAVIPVGEVPKRITTLV
ncbi:MAG TPA: cytochrome D1 domain-containing protein, partial [Hyphomicrobiaceae bacterium]|nr:cytochrome D1 domain-containing protein [Hyphomicrobiaceae bacterium]